MRRILGEYQVTVNRIWEQDDHVDSLEDVGAEPGCDHRRPVRARVQTPKDLPIKFSYNPYSQKKLFHLCSSYSSFVCCCYKYVSVKDGKDKNKKYEPNRIK